MKIWAVILLLMTAVSIASGQTSSGTITGTVTDQQKAVVVGALVTVTNLDTNEHNTTKSDKSGVYGFPSLTPGRYRVTASSKGFDQSAVESVAVDAAVTVTVNIGMQIGEANTVVEVNAEGELINQESATINNVIDKDTVMQLPYPERSALSVATLAPGVSGDPQYSGGVQSENPGITTQPNTPGASISIAGGRPGSASQLVDGFDVTLSGYPRAGITFSKDVIKGVTVQEGFLPAQYGRNGGGIINQATASGSSQYHGQLRWRHYDPFFEARTQGITSPPDAHQNLFTVLVSGPVKLPHMRDTHTFFLAGYEPIRAGNKTYARRRIATPQELAGQFHNSYDVLDTNILKTQGYAAAVASPFRNGGIFNQFSQNIDPNGTPDVNGFPVSTSRYTNSSQYVHYANDDISAQVALNPVAQFLNAIQPTPANPSPYVQFLSPDGNVYDADGNNVTSVRAVTNNDNRYSIRVDHQLGQQDSVFARFTSVPVNGIRYDYFGPTSIADQIPTDTIVSRNIGVGYTHVFSGARVNELRVSYLRSNRYRGPASQALAADFGAQVGLTPAIQGKGFPTFSFGNNLSSIGSGGTETDGGRSLDINFGVGDDFSVLIGRHNIKFGLDYRALQLNRLDDSSTFGGNYSFNQSISGGGSVVSSNGTVTSPGSTLASFDRGLISAYVARGLNPFHYRWKYGAAYVQDDWRIFAKLTLNLGVRYNIETPRMEINNLQGSFVPNYQGPTVTGAFLFSGQNGMPTTLWPINKKGWEPRVGFAYAPVPWISVRSSYALIHEPLSGASNSVFPDLATASTTYGGTTGGVSSGYVDFITNPVNFAGVSPIATTGPLYTYAASAGSSGTGSSLSGMMPYIEQSDKVPYIQTWTLSVQFQFGQKDMVEVAYVGSHGVNLYGPVVDTNVPTLSTLIAQIQSHSNFNSTTYTAANPSPYSSLGEIGCAYLPTQGVAETLTQCDRPYQQFYNNVIMKAFARNATSNYHSGFVRLQHRQSHSLTLIGSFTWSKSRDDGSNGSVDGTVTDSFGLTYPQTPYGLTNEYGLSTYDQPLVTKAAYVYQLPFGLHQRFLNTNRNWLNNIVGQWSTTGIFRAQSGVPMHVQLGTPGYFYSTAPGSTSFGSNSTGSSGAEQDMNVRPNRVPGQPLIKPNWRQDPFGYNGGGYLNSAAFSIPGSQDNPQFGDIQRTLGDARNPRTITFEASLRKVIPLRRRMHLELQTDAINALNHANFFQNTSLSAHNLLTGTNSGNGSFGNLGSASTGRIIALGASFVF